jgi:broad specificity phosphatase PhoE
VTMTEIILVRHGETNYNTSEIFRGRVDVPLNEHGIRQAELLGEYLSKEKIITVYSSPLRRAVRTAEAIAGRHSLDVNVVNDLNDIDCGEWQGLTLKEVQQRYEEIYQDWVDTPEQVRLPGGESLEDVKNRALPFVQDAVDQCRTGTLVLVSHRVVNKVLICALLGLTNSFFWNFQLDTGGISRFHYDGNRVVLTGHNDVSFMKNIDEAGKKDF